MFDRTASNMNLAAVAGPIVMVMHFSHGRKPPSLFGQLVLQLQNFNLHLHIQPLDLARISNLVYFSA